MDPFAPFPQPISPLSPAFGWSLNPYTNTLYNRFTAQTIGTGTFDGINGYNLTGLNGQFLGRFVHDQQGGFNFASPMDPTLIP
jgi:hypothetical protein